MSPTLSLDLQAPNGVKYTQPTGLFINNEFVASSSGQSIVSIDPATEQEIAKVQAADTTDVDKAVRAASAVMKDDSWKKLSASDRGLKMSRLADLIEQKRELFATIDAWDNGKSYKEAIEGDLVEAVGVVRYYAGWADKSFGQTISTTHEKFAYTIRQPIGVVAQIIPWNYPLCMAIWKLGPALACGNAIVLKPADQTPLSALVLAELVKEAGFPPGVFNVVNGGRETGTALVQHPLVDKVAFTGSTATAVDIMGNAAKTLKNVTLETGGKSPLLVFEDAELDQAVKWSHFGIMSNQGQICTATSRILVQDGIYDKFIQSFLDTTKTVSKLGNQWDTSTYQGPLVSKAQYDRVLQYIDIGKKEGATVATGGEPTTVAGDKSGKGFWVGPTVFTDVKPSMRIFREEIFGPVVVVLRFKTEEEAIALANDTTYGLGAAAFTTDLERAHRVAQEIEAGMVWINSSQDCDPRVPFGGVKQSGIGRELGEAGLEAYTNIKAVHVNMGNKL
ncbi:putative aldehyde dehydrogenase-like protein [Colletotrichum sp. SAR 10_99]|nr:putative aldehyde dehydrogenase-like protein [Colletotrichum sp. SAR 10_96]KAI8257521.1 putative aldehyde dehydrogenase-like protein [Colletotrichum sp. SAR 10_98]KAJ5010337.1 putative aldehyde dehydrogenase-like protein [Colletotrichum sp. SAR 10_99]